MQGVSKSWFFCLKHKLESDGSIADPVPSQATDLYMEIKILGKFTQVPELQFDELKYLWFWICLNKSIIINIRGIEFSLHLSFEKRILHQFNIAFPKLFFSNSLTYYLVYYINQTRPKKLIWNYTINLVFIEKILYDLIYISNLTQCFNY